MRAVVITTIFPPSEAVRRFAAMRDWKLFVAGDRKTPTDWNYPGVNYVDPVAQLSGGWKVADKLPWNHYARKMIGYLEAMAVGAEIIADTDDDNIPTDAWSFPAFTGSFDKAPDDLGFVNIYRSFTEQPIWPRGLPLKKILDANAVVRDQTLSKQHCDVGVWQGL